MELFEAFKLSRKVESCDKVGLNHRYEEETMYGKSTDDYSCKVCGESISKEEYRRQ